MAAAMTMPSPARPASRPPSRLHKVDSPMDRVDRHDFGGVQKNRKYCSTGGGRAWTEDEEVYLLQTRLQKMPYKHIAAHLKKTELACRLHYHQLSHGTNRRKRAASFSSVSSTHSPDSPLQRSSPDMAEASTAPTTPEQHGERAGSVNGWTTIRPELPPPSSTASAASPLIHHKPILPKPVPSLPYPGFPRHQHSGLRLDCSVTIVDNNMTQQPLPIINRDRLRGIYEAHRMSFWTTIAAEYGEGVDPTLLEETWRRGSVPGPLTPEEALPDHGRFGPLTEGRVVLPSMQPSPYDRSYPPPPPPSHFRHRLSSVSSAPSPMMRPMAKFPTPSTASTEGPIFSAGGLSSSGVPATAIAALLNVSMEPRAGSA
ncbi:MAG: 60S ribosomal protein L34 [Watsoniomyces obsoletus]|nr:MAG: 60S ribosomal protein L34 [Watsoniomyces obsoletus]